MAKMEDGIFAQLNLSPAQKKKIMAMRAERDAKMKKAMAAAPKGGDPRAAFQAMRPIGQEYRKQIETVMNPTQKAKYEDLRKAQMAKMRAAFGGGRGGPGGGPGGRGPGGPGRGPGGG
jgi:Spy/CpxP family protein refolding chaperone